MKHGQISETALHFASEPMTGNADSLKPSSFASN